MSHLPGKGFKPDLSARVNFLEAENKRLTEQAEKATLAVEIEPIDIPPPVPGGNVTLVKGLDGWFRSRWNK